MFSPDEATRAVLSFLKATPVPADDEGKEAYVNAQIQKLCPEPSIELRKIDYDMGGTPDGEEPTVPFSFTMIKTQEQAYAWYKCRHPDYPDDVVRVMAAGWKPRENVQTSPTLPPKKPVFSIDDEEVEVTFD